MTYKQWGVLAAVELIGAFIISLFLSNINYTVWNNSFISSIEFGLLLLIPLLVVSLLLKSLVLSILSFFLLIIGFFSYAHNSLGIFSYTLNFLWCTLTVILLPITIVLLYRYRNNYRNQVHLQRGLVSRYNEVINLSKNSKRIAEFRLSGKQAIYSCSSHIMINDGDNLVIAGIIEKDRVIRTLAYYNLTNHVKSDIGQHKYFISGVLLSIFSLIVIIFLLSSSYRVMWIIWIFSFIFAIPFIAGASIGVSMAIYGNLVRAAIRALP